MGGGAEKKALEILQYFNEQGYNAHLIVLSSKKIHFDITNIKNIWFADKHYKKPLFGFMELQRKAQALDTQIKLLEERFGKFDVIFANLFGVHRLFYKLNYKKVLYVVHSDPWLEVTHNKKFLRRWKDKIEFKKVYRDKKIICVSKGIRATLTERFGLKEDNINVIYNPFNFNEIREKSNEFDVDFDDYIIHVGRFHPQKRHDILFESFKKMKIKHKLVLLCQDSEELQYLIVKYDLEGKVIVAGFKQNPYPYIKKAKLLLLTSDYEGLPTVLIEALALNVPVVSTNCPTGPNEILTGTLENYLAEVANPDDIVKKSLQALEIKRYTAFGLEIFSFKKYEENLRKIILEMFL